jgi:hypothetical protein
MIRDLHANCCVDIRSCAACGGLAGGVRALRPGWPAIAETAHLSTRAAADTLNRRGIRTESGKQWNAMQVLRARHRLGLRLTPGDQNSGDFVAAARGYPSHSMGEFLEASFEFWSRLRPALQPNIISEARCRCARFFAFVQRPVLGLSRRRP